MKIFITTPDYSLHGGIRIILEWANRLTEWHTVYLYSLKGGECAWFPISKKVIRVNDNSVLKNCDCLIITSPHSIHYQDKAFPPRKFIFMQMCEHLFHPTDHRWQQLCKKFYKSSHHLIAISEWNIETLKNQFGRTGVTHYVGNGINFEHFPISKKEKDNKTILVEGWESVNASKDPLHIGPQVAAMLKNDGYRIIAYGIRPLKTLPSVPDEYHLRPSLQKMNELYERATILIKASRYDARSCAPMEAMTKGTVTARAIDKGDDDLVDLYNCLKVDYNLQQLYKAAKKLMTDPGYREALAYNGQQEIINCGWNFWMPKINDILVNA